MCYVKDFEISLALVMRRVIMLAEFACNSRELQDVWLKIWTAQSEFIMYERRIYCYRQLN